MRLLASTTQLVILDVDEHRSAGDASLLATAEPMLVAVIGLAGARDRSGSSRWRSCVRRRSRAVEDTTEHVRAIRAARTDLRVAAAASARRARRCVRGGGGGGGLAVATSSAMVCPTCRTEYHGMTYCTRDARRLVPPEEMLGGPLRAPHDVGKSAGLVCMACRRAYEPGLRSCPHDGNELVPFPVYNATRPRSAQRDRARRRDRADLSGVRDEVRSQRAVLRPRRRRARRDQLTIDASVGDS